MVGWVSLNNLAFPQDAESDLEAPPVEYLPVYSFVPLGRVDVLDGGSLTLNLTLSSRKNLINWKTPKKIQLI